MFGLDNQQFISAFIVAFYGLGAGFLWLYHHVILKRLSSNQIAHFKMFASDGVKAAMDVSGNFNKQHALKAFEDFCQKFKFPFDLTTAVHYVDAAFTEIKVLVPQSLPIVSTLQSTVDNAAQWLNAPAPDIAQQPTKAVPVQSPASYAPQGGGLPPIQQQ